MFNLPFLMHTCNEIVTRSTIVSHASLMYRDTYYHRLIARTYSVFRREVYELSRSIASQQSSIPLFLDKHVIEYICIAKRCTLNPDKPLSLAKWISQNNDESSFANNFSIKPCDIVCHLLILRFVFNQKYSLLSALCAVLF